MSEKHASNDEDYPLLDEAVSKVYQQAVNVLQSRRSLIALLFHSFLVLIYTSVFASLVWHLPSVTECRRADGVDCKCSNPQKAKV